MLSKVCARRELAIAVTDSTLERVARMYAHMSVQSAQQL